MKNILNLMQKESNVLILILALCILNRLFLFIINEYSENVSTSYINKEKSEKLVADSLFCILQKFNNYDSLMNIDTSLNKNLNLKVDETKLKSSNIDSLNRYKEVLNIELIQTIAYFDSISPLYKYNYRKKIIDKFNNCYESIYYIKDMKIEHVSNKILLMDIWKYIVYLIIIILYPVRWTIIKKRGGKIRF